MQVVCDGLEGDWIGVYEEAQRRGISFTIVSGSSSLGEYARESGIGFISKTGKSAIKELEDFFINLQTLPNT